MYIPINKIITVKGYVFGDTLVDCDTKVKLPLSQKIQNKKIGFIQFIRNGDGVCKILRIVEFDFDIEGKEQRYSFPLFFIKSRRGLERPMKDFKVGISLYYK